MPPVPLINVDCERFLEFVQSFSPSVFERVRQCLETQTDLNYMLVSFSFFNEDEIARFPKVF